MTPKPTKRTSLGAVPQKGDPPSPEIANDVVQAAIFQAGGFPGSHADNQTLSAAGLQNNDQRTAFQPAVDSELRGRKYIIDDITSIPNGSGTTVGEVKTHVQKHSQYSTAEE